MLSALAGEINKSINGAAKKFVDLDEDIGPLLGLFAKSMVLVSTQGKDVVLVMKPPALFDMDMAQRKAREVQEQDWTALPPPGGYHWELIGALGTTSRNDVLGGMAGVRVRGGGPIIAPDRATGDKALFHVPLDAFTLSLTCDPRGTLKIDPAGKGEKPPALPALELLDDRSRVIAVLRLDLTSGDPRFDLARTRAMLRNRLAERADMERVATKEFNEVENEVQKLRLEKKPFEVVRVLDEKANEKKKTLNRHHAASELMQDVDRKAAELQLRYPGTTIVKDGEETPGSSDSLAAKHKQFRFAGDWLFDYGMLTIHQDAKGFVAGTYTISFSAAGVAQRVTQSGSRGGLVKTAVLSGKAVGSNLKLTLFDTGGKSRSAEIILDLDGLGGRWVGDSTTSSEKPGVKKPKAKPGPPEPKPVPLHGRVDRLDSGLPEADWFQDVNTGDFAGYWVHATKKEYNVMLKPLLPGVYEGTDGNGGLTTARNIRGSAAGHLLFIIQSPGYTEASVREAVLSADGQTLTFDPPKADAPKKGLIQPTNAGIELTRQSSN